MRLPHDAGPEALARALSWIEEETAGAQDEVRGRVVLVAAEALANALEHGGGDVQMAVTNDALTITLTVRDAGDGPSAEALFSSELPPDPMQMGGRGLFLIRTLTDTVTVARGTLSMQFCPRASPAAE